MPTPSFNFNYYPTSAIDAHTAFLLYVFAAIAVLVAIVVFFIGLFSGSPFWSRSTAVALVSVGIIVAGVSWFYSRNTPELVTPVFAPRTMLGSLWENYKLGFIEPGSGRTLDNQREGITTSEGESYTMLRAVWMDDRPTFDASWNWTKTNLQRNDHLFSWLYGKRPNGRMGILVEQNGGNSATDADTDIALSLIFAYSRWQDPAYLRAAVPIVDAVWKKETFTVNGRPYLAASDVSAETNGPKLVNPSYLSPYAYRIFGTLIPSQNWNALIDTSYEILDKGIALPLDKNSSAGLPPDWLEVDTVTGDLHAPTSAQLSTNFSYDAIRVPWRIALDWKWNGDARARAVLLKMGLLESSWSDQSVLNAVYAHDGAPLAPYYQSPAMYGGTLGYFMVAAPDVAREIYLSKLQSLYNPDTQTWRLPLNYYDANMVWFGMALYNDALPNLFSLLSASTSTLPASSSTQRTKTP